LAAFLQGLQAFSTKFGNPNLAKKALEVSVGKRPHQAAYRDIDYRSGYAGSQICPRSNNRYNLAPDFPH